MEEVIGSIPIRSTKSFHLYRLFGEELLPCRQSAGYGNLLTSPAGNRISTTCAHIVLLLAHRPDDLAEELKSYVAKAFLAAF